MAPRAPLPPVPARRPTVLARHGRRRVDDWYWLMGRDDPEVLAHLRAENAYTQAALAPLQALRRQLFAEIRARVVETDLSVPVRRGPWWYYTRTRRGESYPVHCRRPARPGEDPPRRPRRDEHETVVLDENALAEGHEYLMVGSMAVSPDHGWVAYGVDTTGAERYELRLARLGPATAPSGAAATEVVADTYYGLAWAGRSDTVFYTRADEAMRPYQVWRHRLGQAPRRDRLVLEEPDPRYTVSVRRTRSGALVVIDVSSTDTSEVWTVPAGRPSAPPTRVRARRRGVEYGIEHLRRPGADGWLLMVTNDGARDFRLAVARDGPRRRWRALVPERPGVRLDWADAFDRWLVLSERAEGEACVRVVPLRPGGPGPDDPFGPDPLAGSWVVGVDEHPATTWLGANPRPDATDLRVGQTSLASPSAVYDVTPPASAGGAGSVVLRKRQPVRRFERGDYRTFRLWAPADDGEAVPVSVVHRNDLLADPGAPPGTAPRRPAPLLLYGYGAYEHSIDPSFSALRLPLLDRGVIYAVAHVRGGGELGRRWYEDGRREAKHHTFDDFVAAARHLVASGFTEPGRLVARGASAGGLLIGAVVNRAPELFRAAVAEVPFVDCLTTMLDPSLPLTAGEWEEWGDPVTDPAAYDTIAAYAPYDNVGPARAPDLLVTAGLNDNRVGYWEPAKWVAKLRAANPDNRVLLRVELGAGHGGRSGRYDAWRDEALVQAFVLDALGVGGGAPAAAPRVTPRGRAARRSG